MNKFQLWMYKRAPAWIIKEDDPRGTVVRMVLVVLSFSPLVGIFVILCVAFGLC